MINITKYFIINQEQFNNILTYLNVNLDTSDKEYTITFMFTNFLAYFLIIMTLIISFRIYKILRKNTYKRLI